MPDIVRLPDKWRQKADRQPVISSGDVDIRVTLRRCADELELAYHQADHNAAFEQGCRFCDWEREHNDNHPELPDA